MDDRDLAAATAPAVTAIVPTRDRPEMLERAVRAILGQDYDGPIECIVVFDQSTPSLPDVPTSQSRILRAIVNHREPGLAGARNAGIEEATGQLIAFCDDDDEWLPGKLRTQQAALAAAPGAAVASTGIVIAYDDVRSPRVAPHPVATMADLTRSRRLDIHPSTILVRVERLAEIGPVDEHIPGGYCEDYDWLLRAARLGPILTVQEPLVRVNWHRASFFSRRWETIVAALPYLLERHPELEADRRGASRVYGQIAFAEAALGNRKAARSWAARALRASLRQPRGYLALLVAARLLDAGAVTRTANLRGRGI